jgi:glycolate oxidase FAD binding subunit
MCTRGKRLFQICQDFDMSGAMLRPKSVADIQQMVSQAVQEGSALEVRGGGSKSPMGVPDRQCTLVDMSAFDQVVDYDPPELVLTVGAGMPLQRVQALVDERNQMLAFEPFDHGPIFGKAAGAATIGGVIAAGVSGSRRLSAGAVRDHLLGFEAVSGRGERFVAGGRVVKNVTGYDLPKLMAGSWGQLAVLTQVTLKVLPKPRTSATVIVAGLDDVRAIAAMSTAMRSQAEVAAAAHLPIAEFVEEATRYVDDSHAASQLHTRPAASNNDSADLTGSRSAASADLTGSMRPASMRQRALTALRVEGFGPSVEARAAMLCSLLAEFGEAQVLAEFDANLLWHDVRTVTPLQNNAVAGKPRGANDVVGGESPLWRINVPPSTGCEVTASLRPHRARWFYDWAGGLIWLTMPRDSDPLLVRAAAAKAGGHATLVRADPELRLQVPALHPQAPAVAALAARIKAAFDPAGVLDPRRFVARA